MSPKTIPLEGYYIVLLSDKGMCRGFWAHVGDSNGLQDSNALNFSSKLENIQIKKKSKSN